MGEQLGVDKKYLDIDAKRDGPQREMFKRLERELYYEDLIKALYAVGDPELAEQLIRKFSTLTYRMVR